MFSDFTQPRRRQLSEETGKILYDGPEQETHVLYFKDDVPFRDDVLTISGKGVLNNRISELLMSRLNELNIDTHYVRALNMREQLIRATEPLPFALSMHNIASGTFANRLGLEEGTSLAKPVPEFSFISEELGHPVVAAEHITSLGWSRFEDIDDILLNAQRINDFLNGQFLALNIRLISFTLKFGRHYTSELGDSQVMITDELSPDTFNLLDLTTGRRLDQQGVQDNPRYAHEIYQEVARRLGVLGMDVTESPLPQSSQDIFPPEKTPNKRSLKKRKKPHGHNSL